MSTARLHLQRGIPIGNRGPMIVCRPLNRGGRAVGIECRRHPRMAHRAHLRHGRRETGQKQLRLQTVFNFSRRHRLGIESLAAPAAQLQSSANTTMPERMKARQRGQRMAYRGRRRLARQPEPKTGKGKTIPRTGIFVRNRRKSVCTSVCTFGFDGQNSPQCLRAVGLRLDFIVGRMRFYAPYAVALKGKALKKLQLRKEVHKVHTASLMSAQPYSSLAFCSNRKSA